MYGNAVEILNLKRKEINIMKTSNHLILSTSPLSQPTRKPCKTASLSQKRFLYRVRLRYHTGKERDFETGLYYYGARYLDSKTGRWLSGDPAVSDYVAGSKEGQGGIYNTFNLHLYNYSNNNPLKYIDPDGKNPDIFSFKIKKRESDATLNAKFASIMNSLVGTPYEYGGESRNGADCSGSILLALSEMGYDLPRITASEMASGEQDWINLNPSVDSTKSGDSGMLNFYDLDETGDITHMNVGVGKAGTPTPLLNPKSQIVDATEGTTLNRRQGRDGQYYKPGAGQINQTYTPFSTEHKPDKQGTINWGVLEDKYRKED